MYCMYKNVELDRVPIIPHGWRAQGAGEQITSATHIPFGDKWVAVSTNELLDKSVKQYGFFITKVKP